MVNFLVYSDNLFLLLLLLRWASVVSSQEDMFGLETSQLRTTSSRNTNRTDGSPSDSNGHGRLYVANTNTASELPGGEFEGTGNNSEVIVETKLDVTLRDSLSYGKSTESSFFQTCDTVY